MKTMIKKTGFILAAFIFMLGTSTVAGENYNWKKDSKKQQQDENYKEIKGKVVDENNEPLIFTNVYLAGTNIATVTNIEGEFVLKVPNDKLGSNIEFSFIGYKNKFVAINDLVDKRRNIIQLESNTIPLQEVKIRPENPKQLVRLALAKKHENYSDNSNLLTAFYRETVKQNRSYVAVSEGVLEVYKAAYTSHENDMVKLFKGRKSHDVKKMDTVMFKLQGGPSTTMLLDIVKHPYYLFYEGYLGYYDFSMVNIVKVNDRLNYIIEFEQRDVGTGPMYNGTIYLDADNLAITAIEFRLNTDEAIRAANAFIRKKPLTMRITPESATYYVNYREKDGKWYFNYARGEVKFKCKWKKKLFSSSYTTMSEIAITDRSNEVALKFKNKEVLKQGDVFVEKVSFFTKDDFWGEYNYIKPDESIESAIKKLNRKFKRN